MPNPLDVFRDGSLAGHVALVTGGGTGICRGIESPVCREPCILCNPAAAGCDGTLAASITTACNDRDLCTQRDHCDGAGECVHEETTMCPER